jgi:hypothetical protein
MVFNFTKQHPLQWDWATGGISRFDMPLVASAFLGEIALGFLGRLGPRFSTHLAYPHQAGYKPRFDPDPETGVVNRPWVFVNLLFGSGW